MDLAVESPAVEVDDPARLAEAIGSLEGGLKVVAFVVLVGARPHDLFGPQKGFIGILVKPRGRVGRHGRIALEAPVVLGQRVGEEVVVELIVRQRFGCVASALAFEPFDDV